MASNGRLPSSMLKTIPGGHLETHTAYSWLRLRAKIGKETGIWICPTSDRCSYRNMHWQEYFWNLYIRGLGALAARPGTSNHGLGTTVDVPMPTMAALINKYGAPYGWQKKWSDAQSEWWHFKYSPEHDQHKGEKPVSLKKHPYHYLTKNEKHWRNVLRRERRIAKRAGGWDKVGAAHIAQAKRAKRELRKCLVRIQKRAKADGKGGWKKHHRWTRARYIRQLLYGKKKKR